MQKTRFSWCPDASYLTHTATRHFSYVLCTLISTQFTLRQSSVPDAVPDTQYYEFNKNRRDAWVAGTRNWEIVLLITFSFYFTFFFTLYYIACLSMYLPNPSPTGRMWHKVNLLSEIQLVLNQSFPSTIVALLRQNNQVYTAIYP